MRHPALRLVTWVFSRLVPKNIREPLIGDLAEEYEQRAKAPSSSAALRWYLQQLCASVPSLLWARLTRGAWLSTLGVALLGYFAAGVADFLVKWAMPNWTANGTFEPDPLGLIITFAMMVLIGYLAERLRRRAAIVLGVMMLLTVIAMTVGAAGGPPLWYRLAYFLAVPSAAVIGGVLRSALSVRSTRS